MKKDNYKKLRALDQIKFFLILQFYKNKSNKKNDFHSYCQRGSGGCPPYVHPRTSTLIYFSPPFSSSTELLGDKISIICEGFSTLPVKEVVSPAGFEPATP